MNDEPRKNDPNVFYDLNAKPPVCAACDCDPKTHVLLWNCPIFQNYKICVECCHEDAVGDEAGKLFSAKLGETITNEQIREICKGCCRNSLAEPKGASDEPKRPVGE
jgi:hypothetical protein